MDSIRLDSFINKSPLFLYTVFHYSGYKTISQGKEKVLPFFEGKESKFKSIQKKAPPLFHKPAKRATKMTPPDLKLPRENSFGGGKKSL